MSALSLRRYRVTLIEVTPLVVEIFAWSKDDAIQAAFDLWAEGGEAPRKDRRSERMTDCQNTSLPVSKIVEACTALINEPGAPMEIVVGSLMPRGAAYVIQGKYAKALVDYSRVIAIAPDAGDFHDARGTAYFGRGMAYFKDEQYGPAIADFDRAIALKPPEVISMAYKYRGMAWEQRLFTPDLTPGAAMDDLTHAVDDFTQAIRLNPRDADAYKQRGLIKKDFLGTHSPELKAEGERDIATAQEISSGAQ